MSNYECGCQVTPIILPLTRKYMNIFMKKYESVALYNIEEIGDEYLITVLLPGRSKKDVQVSLLNHNLNIKASKPKKEDGENQKSVNSDKKSNMYRVKNFDFIDIDMDIELPENADVNRIKPKMYKGILEIRVDKIPIKPLIINNENNK